MRKIQNAGQVPQHAIHEKNSKCGASASACNT